ncbi:ADP-ribosyl cyclase/cyclic ADP-ribose hydrolase [Hirschfeldia incana]|nr:ADP-ribosyl cyclase/cyclic ADP-ribose hydrolase [Hirschfeldia incana]
MEVDVLSKPHRYKYDVFLSFRSEDGNDDFSARLYNALSKEVRVFRSDDDNNEGMERGTDESNKRLFKAMEDSAASVVVFTLHYADSRWCLDELAMLCDLGTSLDRPILPVFYKVDPSHVRKQSDHFEKDFDEHEKIFSEEEVKRWRKAMKLVGNLAGYVYKEEKDEVKVKVKVEAEDDMIGQEKDEVKVKVKVEAEDDTIGLVVKKVLAQVSNTPEKVGEYTVGLESRVKDLMDLVDVKSTGDVQILGLYGMGGIGKTTLAKRFYNKILENFEDHRVFISNVRQESSDGLVNLQQTFIKSLFGSVPEIEDVSSGRDKIRGRVSEKKILAVLDDVDNVDQVDALVGERNWYGEGSVIIITTRDEEILSKLYVSRRYEVNCLTEVQALSLFSYHSLGKQEPTESLMELSKKIVKITGKLPLAVEVFGSHLRDKKEDEWLTELEKLENTQPGDLQAVLALSFKSLGDEEKTVFLDIACLFLKMEMAKEEVMDVLKGCGYNAEVALSVLRQKSLVKILSDKDNTLWMHDQIRDMGMQMVLNENREDPEMRSRLWDRGEIMNVLNYMKGTTSIRGIVLDFKKKFVRHETAVEIPSSNLQNNPGISSAVSYVKNMFVKFPEEEKPKSSEFTIPVEPFAPMKELRLLQIDHVELEGDLKLLPSEIKWIQWRDCPLKDVPPVFLAGKLAVLDLSESGIRRVQTSWFKKEDENLKVVNLRGCHSLEAIPDLSNHKALEKLVFERCKLLVKVPRSVGNLSKLLHLDFSYCSNLTEFQVDVSGLEHLEKLFLSGCSSLSVLPKQIGAMTRLKELLLDGTAIKILPESIGGLESLKKLSLFGCRSIQELPEDVGTLTALEELDVSDTALQILPSSIGGLTNLKKLHLMHCTSLTKIPDTISKLISLKEFFINGSGVKELPLNLGSLQSLTEFSAGGCKSLKQVPISIGGLNNLLQLELDHTPVVSLPEETGDLRFIQKLELRNCKSLKFLPKSIGGMDTLQSLYLTGSDIEELPEEFGKLENLVLLQMNKCKNLKRLPNSFGDLKSLYHLYMEETSVVELPESFGNLSKLMTLKMLKKPLFRSDTQRTSAEHGFVMPDTFSNLESLEEVDARSWGITGKIPDVFEKLTSVKILNLGNNYFHSLPSSLKEMKNLKELILYDCQELTCLPLLPGSLEKLNLADCFSLKSVSDLSELTILQELNLTNCKKVSDVPGLEYLKALKRLYMSGCNSKFSDNVKERLSKSKVSFKMLRNLSMPGDRIPEWFAQGPVRYSAQPNRELRGVIIAVVVSVKQESKDDFHVPDVLGIQAQILKLDKVIVNHMLNLTGVPQTSDYQLHICRYSHHFPMVSMLKEGYTIQVVRQKMHGIKQDVELQMHGIHLVYEGDDDLEAEEGYCVTKTMQTVSQKLANFFKSSKEGESSSQGGSTVA